MSDGKASPPVDAQDQPAEAADPENAPAQDGSRPGSAVRSQKGSAGSRPGSAVKSLQGSRAGSVVKSPPGSRPGSAVKSLQGSRAGSVVKSPPGSRPASAVKSPPGSRAGSVVKSPHGSAGSVREPAVKSGSAGSVRSSGVKSPPGSRPASVVKSPPDSRAGSVVKSPHGSAGSVRGSVVKSPSGSRPGSGVRFEPDSAGSRPESPARSNQGIRLQSATSETKPDVPSQETPTTTGLEYAEVNPESTRQSSESSPRGEWATQPDEDTDRQPPVMNTELVATGEDMIDDEEEDYMEGDEEEDSDDSEGENEMVVLDPDHPLMKRFQNALKQHLEKVNEKVTLDLREVHEQVKKKKGDRESIGVELYGIQQELARHQMMLEKYHDDHAKVAQMRAELDQQLSEVRGQYTDKLFSVNDERKKGAELQSEVENLALRLFYMENAKEDVRSDIAVMKRAAEKAESEVSKAETDKQKQDIYVDRLVEQVDKLREEISMFEAQLLAQGEETKAAQEALTEARMEIESINVEKKQLFQQWNSSLIGMRRRDEAHSAMQEALDQQLQRILSMDTEIEGYKKSIYKEQEQNEKLTLILNKTESDISTVKKMLQACHSKHEALKNEYATYSRMLHETEQALARAITDKTLRQNEMNALRKQIEREYQEKVKLEDEILEKLRTQLTMDKASQYSDKLTSKMRGHTKSLESQTAQVENEIAQQVLEAANILTRLERLRKILVQLDEDIRQKNEIITRSNQETNKNNVIIERKQATIDQLNKKLEQLISAAGGVELGPLEIHINSLQKSIEKEVEGIQEMKQMWLRDQTELVRLTKEKHVQTNNVNNMKKKLTILIHKKLRMENDLNNQAVETADIEKNIRRMQNDMLKLNQLLYREKGMEQHLTNNNVLKENDFILALKDAERESIQMQERLDGMKEEKERLLNSLVEAERQIMLWEKKTQLARETKAAVDSEVGQGEIKAMRAEIHRMEVRYSQLMKQQEKMIQEMEKSVSRRDTIVTRGDAQAKMNKKVLTKGTFQRQLIETKKKIKGTIQDANACDGEIRELREQQQDLGGQLEDRQLNVQQLQSTTDNMDGDIERLLENKSKNLADLLSKQQRGKYYQQLKDGKYTRLCKSEGTLDTEAQKQVDRMQTINAIADRLVQEYPHIQPALKKVILAYGSRATDIDS